MRACNDLLAGIVDVAVVDHHAHTEPDQGLVAVAVVLVDEPVLVWLPADHPRAADEPVDLADLADEAWITSPPLSACWDLLARACEAAGFAPRTVAVVSEYRSAAALVGARVGISIVPRVALGAGAGFALVARTTMPPVTRRLTALLRPGPRPQSVRAALAALQRSAAATALTQPAALPSGAEVRP